VIFILQNYAWSRAAKSAYISKLLLVQRRALRLINFALSGACAIPLYIESKILRLTIIYFDTVANLMHDTGND